MVQFGKQQTNDCDSITMKLADIDIKATPQYSITKNAKKFYFDVEGFEMIFPTVFFF